MANLEQITIRLLTKSELLQVKSLAVKKDIPYQRLIREYVRKGLSDERSNKH